MFYRFRQRNENGTWSSGWCKTHDGIVIETSPAWKGMLGLPVDYAVSLNRWLSAHVQVSQEEVPWGDVSAKRLR